MLTDEFKKFLFTNTTYSRMDTTCKLYYFNELWNEWYNMLLAWPNISLDNL